MGTTWSEIEALLDRFMAVEAFEHAEALPLVGRARLSLAEAALAVAHQGLSQERRVEANSQELLAHARYLVGEAETAVRRARRAVADSRDTADDARRRIAEARGAATALTAVTVPGATVGVTRTLPLTTGAELVGDAAPARTSPRGSPMRAC